MRPFSLFSFLIKKEELALSFTIDSGSVHGTILLLSRENNPKILYGNAFIIPIERDKPENLDAYTKSMLKTFEKSIEDIQKNSVKILQEKRLKTKKIREVFYTFSAPWCISQTRVFSITKPTSVPITESLIESFMKEQKKVLEKEAPTANNSGTSEIIEDKVIKTKLNGYYVDKPIGKKASMIEIVSFMTLVQKETIDNIRDSVARHFNGLKEHTHSFALAFFSVTRDLFPEEHSSLCINIDDEVTDIAIVRHDAVVEHISIPIGNNALIRAIADDMSLETSTAKSTLKIHEGDKLNKTSKEKVSKITSTILDKWYKTLRDTCISLAQELQAPKTIFVLTNNQSEDSFLQKMQREKSLYSQNIDESLSIIPIDVNMLAKQCDVDKQHEHESELYINTIFSNKLFRIQ